MKKYALLFLSFSLLTASSIARAADEAAAPAAEPTAAPAAAETTAAPAETTAAPAVENVPAVAENLEFVSGEVSAIDETAKTVTVKLYGETENEANDKLLTVTLDTSTDITDGEKDRELKSLAAGTEVDVEYDPATKKATYIFVY
ncbi:MAG TPA: hypothetical protein VL404_09010 [Candidatus Eisenbacteria bacterium]|nr:hypothetical protein [Candidatus Eisenbacteria bacterium]